MQQDLSERPSMTALGSVGVGAAAHSIVMLHGAEPGHGGPCLSAALSGVMGAAYILGLL